ncbi:hypothetical protein ACQRXC_28890 (plasmid) [Niallia taxi]|uniref:hypothetical protein n=1 Tax=Niallia TaxID=2837506 RepID=UPI0015F689A7|nr:hypothetical protein [Niallia taxi]MED4057217.1 hypothetical protein [Niallia taxi]MED4122186.1 hypothetical protein [Niallia taxi]
MSNNNEEIKLKETFLINIKSRNDEKKLKFSKWLQAQSNPQNSFLSLIEHCIDRFGYEDVTDHEIAKKLHTEILYFNNQKISEVTEKSEQVIKSQNETKTNHIEEELKNNNFVNEVENNGVVNKEEPTKNKNEKPEIDLTSF